jgi:hypothetical protein
LLSTKSVAWRRSDALHYAVLLQSREGEEEEEEDKEEKRREERS